MLTGYRARSPRMHRSMSAYLRGYIEDADTMYCPGAPKKYRYLQDSWDAGDGAHEHPTQALLDAFTIRQHKGRLEDLKVCIVGDIEHSRVVRSNIHLLTFPNEIAQGQQECADDHKVQLPTSRTRS